MSQVFTKVGEAGSAFRLDQNIRGGTGSIEYPGQLDKARNKRVKKVLTV